jgi:hypothetical protein
MIFMYGKTVVFAAGGKDSPPLLALPQKGINTSHDTKLRLNLLYGTAPRLTPSF